MITNIVKRIYREIKNAEELENQRKELEEKSEKRNREVKASVWLVESKARSNKEWNQDIYRQKAQKNSCTCRDKHNYRGYLFDFVEILYSSSTVFFASFSAS